MGAARRSRARAAWGCPSPHRASSHRAFPYGLCEPSELPHIGPWAFYLAALGSKTSREKAVEAVSLFVSQSLRSHRSLPPCSVSAGSHSGLLGSKGRGHRLHFLMGEIVGFQKSTWDRKCLYSILGKYNLPHSPYREMDCKETWNLRLSDLRALCLLQLRGHQGCAPPFTVIPHHLHHRQQYSNSPWTVHRRSRPQGSLISLFQAFLSRFTSCVGTYFFPHDWHQGSPSV